MTPNPAPQPRIASDGTPICTATCSYYQPESFVQPQLCIVNGESVDVGVSVCRPAVAAMAAENERLKQELAAVYSDPTVISRRIEKP